MNTPILIPVPRQQQQSSHSFQLPENGIIQIPDQRFLFEARWIQQALAQVGLQWEIRAANPTQQFAIVLNEHARSKAQGYTLTVQAQKITVEGDHAGIFYGLCTLRQLLMHSGAQQNERQIEDAPDYPQRGVMLDISRDRVPTMETLYYLIDELAALKVNQIQLYTEHTFAFADHYDVWQHASPITPEEILLLDAYCRERHIALVPNQNSLGHMERWLKYGRYLPLAEKPDGFIPPWGGDWRPPSTVDPLDPASFELFQRLYDELLPHFTSKLFNVGCDEPWELGQGKSKEAVTERGGRVYLDWLLKLHQDVTARGHQMMFWGDIITHYPDLVSELPHDVIIMEWGYESNHPFAEHGKLFADAGIPYYVCCGTSSWNAISGRASNTIGNIELAAKTGLENGAIGLLNTDWGDNGHWQSLPASWIGYLAGAAVSWCYQTNTGLDYVPALNRFIYRDASGVMGEVTHALASVYQMVGPEHINGQILAYCLQWNDENYAFGMQRMEAWGQGKADISANNLRQVIEHLSTLTERLKTHRMSHPQAELFVQEWTQAAKLLRHGAKNLLFRAGETDNSAATLLAEWDTLIMNQREIWLARSRRGGLEDSMRRFEILRRMYQS